MRRFATATMMLMASMSPALADVIEVEMLNRNDAGDRMVFSEELIRAEVGDVIRFLPTDPSHNAATVRDAIPEGQEPLRGRINEVVEYTVTETGLSAIICQPHQSMGMVALVTVGDDLSNADQILEARIPGRGGAKIEALVEEARALIAEETAAPASAENS